MIVVDTNLVFHLFSRGDHSELAGRVLEKDPDWSAPLLWRSEFRSTLVKCVRGGLVDLDDAFRAMDEAELLMAGGEYAVGTEDVLSLALASGCSAYDAEFVALARELRAPLVTTDKELLSKFPGTAVSPERYLAL